MLIVLAGLPIEATFCAFRCASSARTIAAHHADGRTCDDAAPQDGPQIATALTHDCTSHSLIRQAATTVAERADIIAKPVVSAIATIHIAFRFLEDARSTVFSPSPPGTAPATIAVVLRI